MVFENKIQELKLELPEARDPVGSYVASKIIGKMLFISGQISIAANGELIKGKVGRETTLEEELNNLEQIYFETKESINYDTNQLKNKIANYKEPEALQILESKIDKERTYL